MMKNFPDNIHFKYPWRNYQQKVLEELEEHMKDRHLHIVAPPGSGKTVLGLEVAIRINHPTLILAPTLTIRNQWVERLCELFLYTTHAPEWISTDIRKPSFLTVATYQGLHTACTGKQEEENIEEENNTNDEEEYEPEENYPVKKKRNSLSDFSSIIQQLKKQNIGTIVVDEAHHLKNEWWNTLIKVKKELNPFIVGLTATPPYDVNYTEWKRYLDLNGPIDAEISVPELVHEGDLCPHQDHIYFSFPTEKEKEKINRFRHNALEEFNEIRRSPLFMELFSNLPFLTEPKNYLEWIYENLPVYTSCLIFLYSRKIELSKEHFEILGITSKTAVPLFEQSHLEILLNFFLFQDNTFFNHFENEKEKLKNLLQRKGLVEKNRVNFTANSRINKLVVNSKGKIESILKIVNIEYSQLKSDLRMVILSDYIRSEHLEINLNEKDEFPQMGVVPIFEYLRIHNEDQKKIGVLTGTTVIIPISSLSTFKTLCRNTGIENSESFTREYRNNYLLITPNQQLKNQIVRIITALFQKGEIEILVGTKSLLGEGWDAPAINSLILASFVGSFVLSNQMRGRAIRAQKGNDQKTSNIWHLVCIDPTSHYGGNDVALMTRRFKSFIGISNDEEPVIQNGVERLNLNPDLYNEDEIKQLNTSTIAIATDRVSMQEKWSKAIVNGTKIVEEIKIPYPDVKNEKNSYQAKKRFYLQRTIAYLIFELGLVASLLFYSMGKGFFRGLSKVRNIEDFLVYIGIFIITFTISLSLILGKQIYKTLKLYLKYRDISKDIQNIGETLLHSLIYQGTIKSAGKTLSVITHQYKDGSVHCYLKGGTTFEQTAFVDNLQEIVNVIDNPRYIIVRKNSFIASFEQKDYHSVPEILGKNKKSAEYFHKEWKHFVGKSNLIYTRTIEGRKLLLEARIKALSNQLADRPVSEQMSKWR